MDEISGIHDAGVEDLLRLESSTSPTSCPRRTRDRACINTISLCPGDKAWKLPSSRTRDFISPFHEPVSSHRGDRPGTVQTSGASAGSRAINRTPKDQTSPLHSGKARGACWQPASQRRMIGTETQGVADEVGTKRAGGCSATTIDLRPPQPQHVHVALSGLPVSQLLRWTPSTVQLESC